MIYDEDEELKKFYKIIEDVEDEEEKNFYKHMEERLKAEDPKRHQEYIKYISSQIPIRIEAKKANDKDRTERKALSEALKVHKRVYDKPKTEEELKKEKVIDFVADTAGLITKTVVNLFISAISPPKSPRILREERREARRKAYRKD